MPGSSSSSSSGGGSSPIQESVQEIGGAINTTVNVVAKQVQQTVSVQVQNIKVVATATATATKKIINTPQGSMATKTVSTVGVLATTAVATGSVFSFSFLDLFLMPFRIFGLLAVGFGLKKKILPWGVVYDSVTKQPIDPAYVVLKDSNGKEISSAITDLDGRYGFLVEPGIYQMQANKTNYIFPSQKFGGKTEDELYGNLYFGGNIEIKNSGDVITKNIPMDAVNFDWNEFAKKNKNLMTFYSKWDYSIRKISDLFFAMGFVVAILAYIFAPYPYNTIIMFTYLLFLLLRAFGLKLKAYGYVSDKLTGAPLSFAIIRVLMSDSNREVALKPADKYGRYYCLVPAGKYYVKIDKKNGDGSYSSVYTSAVIDVSKKGIIKEKFSV